MPGPVLERLMLPLGLLPIVISAAVAMPFLGGYSSGELKIIDAGYWFHVAVVPFLSPLLVKLVWRDRARKRRLTRLFIFAAYLGAWFVVGATGSWIHMGDVLFLPASLLVMAVALVNYKGLL